MAYCVPGTALTPILRPVTRTLSAPPPGGPPSAARPSRGATAAQGDTPGTRPVGVPRTSSTTAGARALPVTLFLVAVTAATAVGVRRVDEQSAWLHLAVGRFLSAGGRFGTPDPWSTGASATYRSTEALPAIVMYRTSQLAGLGGVAWLRAVGILALLAALVWGARRVADAVPAVLAAAVGLLGAGHALTARPQLLGLVLLAVVVMTWWRTAGDLQPRWWLVPLGWAAAWVHGLWVVGVVVGVATVAGLLLDRRVARRDALRLMAIPALSAAAAALTSYGPGLVLTPFTVGRGVRDFVGEWQPTSARDVCALAVLVPIGVVAVHWMRSPVRPAWWQVAHLVLAAGATLSMSRMVAVGAVLAAPLLAETLQAQRRSQPSVMSRRSRNAAVGAVLAASLVAAPLASVVAARPAGVPEKLSGPLSHLPAGTTVLTQGDMSSWVLWSQPQLRLPFDSRSEIYSRQYHLDFARLMAAAPGWGSVLDRTRASYALVLKDSPIAAALVERRHWSPVATDHAYVLLSAAP
jgi:hypothetical protein